MLQTMVYRKRTNQNYLDPRSEHPKLLKDSIPYSQALWIKRICSSHQKFLSHATKIINQFQKCGYNRLLIKQQTDTSNSQKKTFERKKRKTLQQLYLYRSNITKHSPQK